MTSTQVQYWSYKETQRHDIATESLGTQTLNETIKHNRATEKLGTNQLKEDTRHNKATEQLGTKTLTETKRHNKATEKETKRSNKRRESLTAQANRIQHESVQAQRERNRIEQQKVDIDRQLKSILGDKYLAETEKIAKETENMNLYKIISSKGSPDQAKKIAATALLADTILDPNQSKTMKNVAAKQLKAWNDVYEQGKPSNSPSDYKVVKSNGAKYYIPKKNSTIAGGYTLAYTASGVPGYINKKGEWKRLLPP